MVFKRILKSSTFTFIGFFLANLIVAFFISFMFWVSIISAFPQYPNVGRWISPNLPYPIWEEIYHSIPSFIEVFIMIGGMYFGMILLIIIIVIINHHRKIKQIDIIYKNDKKRRPRKLL